MPKADLILVPVDFSPPSERAAEFARSLAVPLGSRMRLLHVVQGSAPPLGLRPAVYDALLEARDRVLKEAEQALETLAGRLAAGDGAPSVEHVVIETAESVGDAIVDEARKAGADLIVIGTHGRRGVERVLLGSVAERVVRRADCPVVTVRATP
ncbi:MAG TPA: universal stress protein [Thermodesulfobacteriota bacterium]